jgi:hypothetical protein
MNSTVIDFNAAKIKKIEQALDKAAKDAAEAADLAADEDVAQDQAISDMATDIVVDVIDFLLEQDIDVRDDPMTIYDILLLHEVLKSLTYRAMKEEYPIQQIAESMLTLEDPLKSLNDFLDLTSD